MDKVSDKDYAIAAHKKAGCTYYNLPFETHLQSVVNIAMEYSDYLTEAERSVVLSACWCHDILEDTSINYGTLLSQVGEEVANIVYNVTDELGKTRYERAIRTYPKIALCRLSKFVKLCDRISNVEFSLTHGNMLPAYKLQHQLFFGILYVENEFEEMWIRLCKHLDKKTL